MTTFTTEDREGAEKPEIIRDQSPCDSCEHFDLCKEYELACRSFAKFVVDNYYYKDSFRDPCKGTFNKIFNQKDDEVLKRFVREGNEDKPKSNEGE